MLRRAEANLTCEVSSFRGACAPYPVAPSACPLRITGCFVRWPVQWRSPLGSAVGFPGRHICLSPSGKASVKVATPPADSQPGLRKIRGHFHLSQESPFRDLSPNTTVISLPEFFGGYPDAGPPKLGSSFDFKMIRAPWRISKCSFGQTNNAFAKAAWQIRKSLDCSTISSRSWRAPTSFTIL
jgi:hypothetical protein